MEYLNAAMGAGEKSVVTVGVKVRCSESSDLVKCLKISSFESGG
jgi:hypothetical protein